MKPRINCIMLIDDDALTNANHRLVIDEFNCADYIITKESAETALVYLATSSQKTYNLPFPELIFVDIEMPGLSGWKFLEKYKEIKDSFPVKPVIYMLSSYVLFQNLSRLSNSPNLSGLCEKPLTTELVDAIFDKYFICA